MKRSKVTGTSATGKIQNRREFLYSAGCASALPIVLPPAVSPARSAGDEVYTKLFSLDGTDWVLAVDPDNVGRREGWEKGPAGAAKPARVPWVIQDNFPDFHGVAWYWRQFQAPAHFQPEGRYLLRFHAVDYLAEVWANGSLLGSHEGGEEPFVLDATSAIQRGQVNRIAVRVLNPTHEAIDGIRLSEVAEGRRDYPVPRDNAYNTGGITGPVELLLAPVIRVEDLYAAPDWKTEEIRVRTNLRNASGTQRRCSVKIRCAPASGSETITATTLEKTLPPGDNLIDTVIRVPRYRLWQLNDPFLYSVSASVCIKGSGCVDERTIRCGFRDFRFEAGYFRLNGQRIRLHGALYTILQYPISQTTPYDEDLLRRDVLNMKAMGFNAIRVTCGAALPRQLDLLDEVGLLVCEEHFGARELSPSASLEERWDRSITGVIRRDRNHPSIVMWSLLNEVKDGRLFRHAVSALPQLRELDESRIILLGSGRFDDDAKVGSLSNPGSKEWNSTGLRDIHAYPRFPHSAADIQQMRRSITPPVTKTAKAQSDGEEWRPVLLSEYGVCGAQDYPRFLRHFEQLGKEHAPDARLFRKKMDVFEVDWKKWRLDECWARPEDYFAESQRVQAKLALSDYNAWLANPALVGDFTSTQITDAWFHGCGITNYFRELKPGMADAFNDMALPVRWCLFVDQANVYRGATVHLDAVLVNQDVLNPGTYPVRLQVVGPKLTSLMDTTLQLEIAKQSDKEVTFARPVFSRDVVVAGPPGQYRFLANFHWGAPAGGGEAHFYVGDPAAVGEASTEFVLWGKDERVAAWLEARGFRFRDSLSATQTAREVILAVAKPSAESARAGFAELAMHIGRGSAVVFLSPEVLLQEPFAGQPLPLQWLPRSSKTVPQLARTPDWYFRADPWAKEHPVFAGLPAGGILDYTLFRDIISANVFRGFEPPVEAISGAIQTSGGPDDYQSDLVVACYKFGTGRVILNSLQIAENLGAVPAAEQLLRNLLRFAAEEIDRPIEDLSPGFADEVRALYRL